MQPEKIICPLCNDPVDKLVYRFHLDGERQVLELIRKQNPDWTLNDGICSRCLDYYHTEIVMQQRILPEIGPYFPVRSVDDFIILPTGLRLNADLRFTGKNVTICFIDSGFYPHPDLTHHRNRIKVSIDITTDVSSDQRPSLHSGSWHGTMTSVVCAGDGYLSNGLYKGIACDAELVLLRVQHANEKISNAHIEKAFEWVLKNHTQYDIRIVNISLGADDAISYKQSRIDQLAEELVQAGITVVAAVGNDEQGTIKPPADAPSVIAVGGVDDENSIESDAVNLYHSTYGLTLDSLAKPDLVAPAIWIAAPILPETNEQLESETLHYLLQQEDETLPDELYRLIGKTQLDGQLLNCKDIQGIRKEIRTRIQSCKYISPHYMHVDGTSFAAPIVSSVIAQLLQAQPDLTPAAIRQILFSTAERLEQFPAQRQGFGMIRPKGAVLRVLKQKPAMQPSSSPKIDVSRQTIAFHVQHHCAEQVALAGSFNHWAKDVLLMEPEMNGTWRIEIPMLPAGKYHYKFFVDQKRWLEDINNPYREPDGFSGFNSILLIES